MAWAKLCDSIPFDAKIVAAGNAAVGLWCRCLAYCAGHLTDGAVPRAVVWLLSDQESNTINRAVRAGLLEESGEGKARSYRVHGYLEWNPDRESVLADRLRLSKTRAAAGQLGGMAKAANQARAVCQGNDTSETRSERAQNASSSPRLLGETVDTSRGGVANTLATAYHPPVAPSRPVLTTLLETAVTTVADSSAAEPEVGSARWMAERLSPLGVIAPKWIPLMESLAPYRPAEVDAALEHARKTATGGKVSPGLVLRIVERWRSEPPAQAKGPAAGSEWAAGRQREEKQRRAEASHRRVEDVSESERGRRQEAGAEAVRDILAKVLGGGGQ